MEPANFRLVPQCHNQLHHDVHPLYSYTHTYIVKQQKYKAQEETILFT
jgi:hypothetical protein